MTNATVYFANNNKVFISTTGTYFSVRNMETMELQTYVPKTKIDAKVDAFKFELEALLKSLNFNLDAFNNQLISDKRLKAIHSRS